MPAEAVPPGMPAPIGLAGLVSIVMPVYNGAALIRQAIDSALAQTYVDWELIVVDDGSTDETAAIVSQYTDPRVRYVYQQNRGQAAALNRGLDAATGEFVTTLDADDWYEPTALACRVDLLAREPAVGVVYGNGVYRYATGDTGPKFTELMPAGVSGDVFDTLVVAPFYGTGAAVIVRRSVLAAHGIRYDETISWCQDWDIYIRLAAVARFGYVDDVVINYRVHADGMTVTMPSERRLLSLFRLRDKVLAMPRFAAVPAAQRYAFFYDYLTRDLDGRVERQAAVLAGPAFSAMPAGERALLLRLTANGCVLKAGPAAPARQWLRAALRIKPADPKTWLVYLLVSVSPAAARRVVAAWQGRRQPDSQVSPFEQLVTRQS